MFQEAGDAFIVIFMNFIIFDGVLCTYLSQTIFLLSLNAASQKFKGIVKMRWEYERIFVHQICRQHTKVTRYVVFVKTNRKSQILFEKVIVHKWNKMELTKKYLMQMWKVKSETESEKLLKISSGEEVFVEIYFVFPCAW